MDKKIIDILHTQKCSCVIEKDNKITIFHRRGVADLHELHEKEPQMLKGANIADKVVGKGAAAIMVAGGVKEVYADVISIPALKLLSGNGITVEYNQLSENIRNRTNTGICPVELICMSHDNVADMLDAIAKFLKQR